KMLNLIKSTKANGVIFLSGDVHYSEISKLQSDSLYPIYDITSSGLSETWKFATPNVNRIEGPIMDNNFGLLSINWKKKQILMEIWDKFGNQRVEYSIPINQLKF
ncbi:MAG: alkaline phosphatase family protein, partial [Flavobacteriia bacterium]